MKIGVCCGILAITAFLTVLLRQYRPEMALGLSVAAGAGVTLLLVSTLGEPLRTASEWLRKGGVDEEIITLLLKALGICLLTQVTADVCKDAGDASLAAHAEFVGRGALLLLILPVFVQMVDLAVAIAEGTL